MAPVFSVHYGLNTTTANSVFLRQPILTVDPGFIFLENLLGFFIIKKRHAVLAANINVVPGLIPTLFPPIAHVVGVSTKKKMGWSYARWVVAFVQNVKSFWDLTKGKLPTKSMGKNVEIVWSRIIDNSIILHRLVCQHGTRPEPTRFRFINLIPKPFFRRAF